MSLSFRGEFDQKVDGKGRMSIPADFRRVLESGDPDFPEKNSNPRMVVLYGKPLKDCLHVYSIDEMAKIEADIMTLPTAAKRDDASKMILRKSWQTEVDGDGRIVLPKIRREQIGLGDKATMAAMGSYFEIWNTETYTADEESRDDALLANMPDNSNPVSLLDEVRGG